MQHPKPPDIEPEAQPMVDESQESFRNGLSVSSVETLPGKTKGRIHDTMDQSEPSSASTPAGSRTATPTPRFHGHSFSMRASGFLSNALCAS
jgi:hypothetical protein